MLTIMAFSFYSVYNSVLQAGEEDTFLYVQVLVAVIGPLLVGALFYFMKLETRVDGTGIYYRFFPLHLTEQTILWDEVASVTLRKYNSLKEYGGWGLRYSFKKGRAVNIKGKTGLQLELKNGKKLLIGTQKPEELKQVLQELGR